MQLIIRRRLADRIWQWRKGVYAASTALVVAVLGLVFLTISLPTTILEVSTEPTFFDARRAHRTAYQLAEQERREGRRVVGSPGAKAAAEWVAQALDSLRIPYEKSEFQVRLGDQDQTLRNIAVILPGQSREAVLVSAPRDPRLSSDRSEQSSELEGRPPLDLAGASGTAVLLDLVQVFAARPHEKTLIFLSSEGGSFAGPGLDHFLQTDPRGEDVKTILSVQELGREGREEIEASVTGPDTATPGWYVRLAADTFSTIGVRLRLPGLDQQIAAYALRLDEGEQVAGLRRGRAALLLRDSSDSEVTSRGLATQGPALERLVLSLDSGLQIPQGPDAALVLPSGRYLTTRALDILGLLMLLPSAVMAVIWLAITRLRPEAWLRYLRNLVSFVLPLLAALGLCWLAAVAGLLPRFAHQAPPVASSATRPDGLMVLVLGIGALGLFFVSRHYLGYLRPREPLVMAEMSKLSLGLLVLLAGLALLMTFSPFSLLTAVTAAWVWPLATCFAEPRPWTMPWWPRRRANTTLLLTGLLAPALLYTYLVTATPVGWTNGWWFLLVQTVSGAYGVRGPLASALITTGFLILLGVKRLQLLPMETLEEVDDLSLVAPPPTRVRAVRRVH